ncbi:uncharacterized protein [Drosophila pseudoobscura]|uniref:Uncharacterized protein isoform X2 n=2 Tax=Drosophila pseudoobscura pseudoobscura TaxID=46245 RepID=A0A6I8UE74_DROPS|nr:uncharacterized protein LOC4813633 isoform X2 [Drosophila pseudoobscura]
MSTIRTNKTRIPQNRTRSANIQKLYNPKIKIMGLWSYLGRVNQIWRPVAPPAPETPEATPNLGEKIREVVNDKAFENAYDSAAPFVMASLGSWPGYWLYRGLDYHTHRAHIPLRIYINQTFYQAKILQFVIILAGTFTVITNQRRAR